MAANSPWYRCVPVGITEQSAHVCGRLYCLDVNTDSDFRSLALEPYDPCKSKKKNLTYEHCVARRQSLHVRASQEMTDKLEAGVEGLSVGSKFAEDFGGVIGIDLGTTYSCVAVWLESEQRTEVRRSV